MQSVIPRYLTTIKSSKQFNYYKTYDFKLQNKKKNVKITFSHKDIVP